MTPKKETIKNIGLNNFLGIWKLLIKLSSPKPAKIISIKSVIDIKRALDVESRTGSFRTFIIKETGLTIEASKNKTPAMRPNFIN